MPTLAELLARNDKVLDSQIARVEREVVRNYRAALEDIRAELARLYDRYAVEGVLTHAEMSKFNRLKGLDKFIRETMNPVFKENRKLTNKLQKVEYEEGFYRTAWAIDRDTGAALKWGILRPESVVSAVANPMKDIALKRLTTNSLLSIRSTVTQGLIRGDSFPKMARNLRRSINSTASDNMRIVRTEGNRAQNQGIQETYRYAEEELDIDLVEFWDAILDSRVRDSHARLEGQPKNEEHNGWFLGGVWAAGPGQSGVASEDINCRCRVRAEVKDFPPTVKGERKTYEEWRKEFR